ncbi:MAG: tRNA (N6-isopentenyl adenosine(37)-C2)-methylthiotransferase MiaB, partial [bacterium]
MNEYDSAAVADMLEKAGWKASAESEADLIIVNTCAVRQAAEDRAIGHLLTLAGTYPKAKVGIMGCVAQEKGAELLAKYPQIAFAVGPGEIDKIPEAIEKIGRQACLDVDRLSGDGLRAHIADGSLKAFIAISRGCENFCSYCIVPYVRGKLRSRSIEDILDEARCSVEAGVREITLLGQNVNSYFDKKSNSNFARLLDRINDIEGLARIRYVTNHPKDMSDDIIDAIAEVPKVCEAIHLPVQSGSTKILRAMNRGYTREDYLNLVDKIKKRIPDVTLTTDIIAGFPGETDADFEDTVNLYKTVGYAASFAFRYSVRPGTAAEKLDDDVPEEIKISRLERIIDLGQDYAAKYSQSLPEKTREVLVEGTSAKNPEMTFGYDRGGRRVLFPSKNNLRGELVNVVIKHADKW